jgi:Starch-binding associating with outer membrane
MKIIKLRNIFALIIIVALSIIGCKKADFAINTDTTNTTTPTLDYKTVLPASLVATAQIQATQWKFLQSWLGYWARSGTYQSVDDEETYTFTNNFPATPIFGNIWDGLYGNAKNYDFIASNAKTNGAGIYEAIARIMKAQDFQMLVDIYGNVPYTEAFTGIANRTPKYDDDAAIYADLFKELDASIALLKNASLSSAAANPAIATNDLVYAGNTTKWVKFANTLKLRLLMHMANTSFAGGTEVNTFIAGANQVAEMAKITAEGSGFIGAGETAFINPGFNASKPNPYYRAYINNENGGLPGLGDQTKANSYACGPNGGNPGYYAWNGDPRVNKFYGLSSTGIIRGIPYGEVSGFNPLNVGTNLATLNGSGIVPLGAASNAWILTSTESLFLQAEAMRRGLLVGSAGAMTNNAITESFVSLGLTAAQASSYISGNATYPDVDFNGVSQGAGLPAGGMYTILSQKWFALNVFAPLEVWTDYRRANMVYGTGGGFIKGPLISVHPQNAKSAIPIRLFYPQDEYNYNATNVGAEGTIDVFTAGGVSGRNRIFWDKN